MNRFDVLGVNDDQQHCECCGREGLKRVVWIRDNETGTVKHFGTSCANAPAKGFGLVREIRAAVKAHDHYLASIAARAHHEYRKAGGAYVSVGDFARAPADRALYDSIRDAIKGAA